MSSSSRKPRDSRRERASSSRTSSYYPTQWCEWEWSEQRSCWQRYRLRAKGEYEFEYDKKQTSTEPRTTQPPNHLDPIQESTTSDPSQSSNYTHTPVAEVTEIFHQTSLGGPTSTSAGPTLGSGTAPGVNWGPAVHIPNLIKSKDPHTLQEPFDPHYQVHKEWEFKYGKVFKILWAEPGGSTENGSNSGGQSVSERKGPFGERVFQKVRRFVIIDPRRGHCICLPVNTYSGQGTNKKGVQAKDHTIIYTGKNPVAFKGEQQKGLNKIPIKMNPASPRHKLDNASRLNYAKPYTVEYNVKVWFIGVIHDDYQWQLGTDYNIVNPPVQPRGLPPPTASQDAYGHTGGGFASASESSSFNPYATASSTTTPYSTGTGYTIPISSFPSTAATTSTGRVFGVNPATVAPQAFSSRISQASEHGDGPPLSRINSHDPPAEAEQGEYTQDQIHEPNSPMPPYEPQEHEYEPTTDPQATTETSPYGYPSYSPRPGIHSRASAPENPGHSEPSSSYFTARSSSFDASAFPEHASTSGRWRPASEPKRSNRSGSSRRRPHNPEEEPEPEPQITAEEETGAEPDQEHEPEAEYEHGEENLYDSS